jgi:hypothetical protein
MPVLFGPNTHPIIPIYGLSGILTRTGNGYNQSKSNGYQNRKPYFARVVIASGRFLRKRLHLKNMSGNRLQMPKAACSKRCYSKMLKDRPQNTFHEPAF